MRDRAVQKTDTDAAQSKASAVNRGYFEDKFINLFCRNATPRLPLINIGTYCRVQSINALIHEFLQVEGKKQIISLGAGSDTRPFHLLPAHPDLVYVELDFPVKTQAKLTILKSRPELADFVANENYHLCPVDLRKLEEWDYSFLDPDAPTLVLSECCLCYLSPEESDSVLKFFAKHFSHLSLTLYEPIGLDDEFGRVMMHNLAQRGLCLPTFQKFNTLEAQKVRIKDLGLQNPQAKDIFEIYQELPESERARINRLEFLDEVEEMQLLLEHYSLVWVLP